MRLLEIALSTKSCTHTHTHGGRHWAKNSLNFNENKPDDSSQFTHELPNFKTNPTIIASICGFVEES